MKLHVEEVKERVNRINIEDKEYNLSDLDTCKKEISEELWSAEYNDLEDMV